MPDTLQRLSVDHLHWRRRQQTVLHDLGFSLKAGDMLAVIGPNGAGKSSLLRCLAGLEHNFDGRIQFDGVDIRDISPQQRAHMMAYLPQQFDLQWPLSVQHLVELGRLPYQGFRRRLNAQDREIVAEAMRDADVYSLANRAATELSGGELARVMLARTFASRAPLILADEPIAALDPYHQLHIMELLQQHCQRGGSVVIVMHDLNLAARFCDRVLVLKDGALIEVGAPQTVLRDNLIANVYGVSVQRSSDGHWFVPNARLVTA